MVQYTHALHFPHNTAVPMAGDALSLLSPGRSHHGQSRHPERSLERTRRRPPRQAGMGTIPLHCFPAQRNVRESLGVHVLREHARRPALALHTCARFRA
jgi:hypothetical protein